MSKVELDNLFKIGMLKRNRSHGLNSMAWWAPRVGRSEYES